MTSIKIFVAYLFSFLLLTTWEVCIVTGIRFSAESFSEISLLAKEGKVHLESLREKANVPQYGPCWKNAISNLQIGCKFLSENVQSDLALRFTDCFLQMSGHEPMKCNFSKSLCLKKLSDRAFNAYTEFYTHTQSICYFLQSQVWHEETEKTIDKLSSASQQISQKLEEAEKIQGKLLEQQKRSLSLQYDLIDRSKNVASELQLSQDKISTIMKDFQSSTLEQKQLFIELFEHLLSFKLWAIDEMSWLSSTVFFVAATVIGFLFTSISRTKEARIYIFIVFTLNYLFERFISSKEFSDLSNVANTIDVLNSWIWLCRKFCICFSAIITLYSALMYYDYSLLSYKLLLEIKKQNLRILDHFKTQNDDNYNNANIHMKNDTCITQSEKIKNGWNSNKTPLYSNHQFDSSRSFNVSPRLIPVTAPNRNYSFLAADGLDGLNEDEADNMSINSEKSTTSQQRLGYNLRSNRFGKK